ncbi:MAG TPA: ABC transporter permease [Acidimicrobiales bacterium]|nr:ABC transporter permease [Acidimicrobiales bacterium]
MTSALCRLVARGERTVRFAAQALAKRTCASGPRPGRKGLIWTWPRFMGKNDWGDVMTSVKEQLVLGEGSEAHSGAGGPATAPSGFLPGRFMHLPLVRHISVHQRYRLRQSALDLTVLFLLIQVGSVVAGSVWSTSFAYTISANILTALEAIPLLGITAIGVGVLMVAGEFDLSVGSNFIFSSIVMAMLIGQGWDPFVAALFGLAIGAGIGLLNGLITLWLRIPSLITTLGTTGIWAAATLFVHGAASQTFNLSGPFATLTSGTIGVFPAEMFWMLGLAVATWALLQRHRLGNHLFAVGGNAKAANATGISVRRTKLFAFVFAGTLAALAGILAATRVATITPGGETDLPLQAIGACVIGGTALMGGSGTVLGMALGAALLYWIEDVLLLLGAPGFYLDAFVGALIIVAAALYGVAKQRRVL